MFYKVECQKRVHREIDKIFRVLLPERGLAVREQQIRLCHEMLDTLLEGKVALCDAGVGIGKTYAYLVACVMMRKYFILAERFALGEKRPVVISTSSIALQKAIISEYIPFLSRVLVENGLIQSPIRAVVRKGKEHFVCDNRLEQRLQVIQNKKKNAQQKEALLSLKKYYDMDEIQGLSGFDRRLVCVPKFCPRDCEGRPGCRYQWYLGVAREKEIFIQICNHNYLLADSSHRVKGYRPLLADYQALIIDEAHQLPEAARQMYGKILCYDDIREIGYHLEREYQREEARIFKSVIRNLFGIIGENHISQEGMETNFHLTDESALHLKEGIQVIDCLSQKLKGAIPKWVLNRLEETKIVLECFSQQDSRFVLHLKKDRNELPILCAANRELPKLLYDMLWSKECSAILTSGTLKAGKGFERTRQVMGLEGIKKVQEYVAASPFAYDKNCLLFLPKTLKRCKHGSREEAKMVAAHIRSLITSTYGHTLVLFTSYSLMGSVYQILRDEVSFPLVEVWRHAQEEIIQFKRMENAVLFAAGSCWEGVDFPGDMVSSLIIVKLPFAVPDPISKVEKEEYGTLEEYIETIIVPDMQKKLRQGFGRAIRTETDTCVVSILDYRAVRGGKYYHDIICALPVCQMAEELKEVQAFIRSRKGVEYYL